MEKQNVSVPESVRKAAEEADKFIQSQQNTAQATLPEGEQKPNGTPEPEPQKPAAKTPEPTPDPKQEQKADDFQPLDRPLGDDDAKWQDRYKILQGKYNAEVPKLRQEIKALTEQQASNKPVDMSEVNGLKAEVDRLKQQLSAATATKPAGNMSEREKQLRNELGDEVFDYFDEKYGKQFGQISQQVNETNSRIEQTANQSNVETRKLVMRQRLAPKGVDFDVRNNDPLFIDFINSRAENGVALGSILSNAFANGDLDKVEEIFLAYETPAPHQAAPQSSAPDLSQHVQIKPSAAPTDAAPQVEPWTEEQIKALYQDQALGRLSQEDFTRYEKSLYAWLATQN